MTTLLRIINTGIVSFRRNILLSSATTLVLVLSLSVAVGTLLFGVVVDGVVAELESKVDISVYFKQNAAEEDIVQVRTALEKFPEVLDAQYTSRDEAFTRFRARHDDNETIKAALAELPNNPLEASLAIRAADASAYSAIASFLEGRFSNVISKVNYRENSVIINRIFSVTNAIRLGALVIGVVLFFIAGLVAFNTIRLAIFSSKDEISVMRLVGASNWFIRGPFVVAGSLNGLLGAALTFVLFFGIVSIVRDPLARFIPGVDLVAYYKAHWSGLLGFMTVLGIGTSIVSSAIAIRRYLRV